jgi:hypothetical protein
MLDCNITGALYNHIRKEQFGICSNVDTLLSMALNEIRLDLGCSSTVLCYTPETCVTPTTVGCSIVLNGVETSVACTIILSQ